MAPSVASLSEPISSVHLAVAALRRMQARPWLCGEAFDAVFFEESLVGGRRRLRLVSQPPDGSPAVQPPISALTAALSSRSSFSVSASRLLENAFSSSPCTI